MDLVEIEKLVKRYDTEVVLEQEKFALAPGTHLLLGANGSGKSTFLKILAGLIPFEGKITLFGEIRAGKDHRQQRLEVSYAESEPRLPPYLNGNYLVEMYRELKQSNQEEIQSCSQFLGIDAFLDQKISAYSSGMKKKLALLLAFLGSPRLILLDEPFNALDVQAKAGLESLIRQRINGGSSFILATHVHTEKPRLPFSSEIQIENRQFYLQSDVK